MIQMNIVSAPDELREQIRYLTRMQLIRTLATWRPRLSQCSGYPAYCTKINELTPELIKRKAVGHEYAYQLLLLLVIILSA